MAGLAEEDSLDDQKKGPVVYQEQKSFVGEWSIITVYDNQEQKRVTFEVYGCDTSDILRVQYNYVEFDAFFRFNAELMNPNRREGRYHWVAERLEVQADGAGGRKLGLASDPTPELPEQPLYEKRKIPTGRMNYQERQRLRESMDQLDIKRNEAITKKRTEAKARFLVKMAEQKDEYLKRLGIRTEKIAREREERWVQKEGERKQELEAILELEARMEVRNSNVTTKEESTEERDAQEVKDILKRYKEKEAIRQQEVKEARAERAKKKVQAEKEGAEAKQKAEEISAKREEEWRQRELRVQKKRDGWLQDLLKEKEIQDRDAKLKGEKKLEFIKDLHVERQKVFTEQNLKSERRRREIEDTKPKEEEEQAPAVQSAEEEHPVGKENKKPAVKGKKAATKGEGKKSPKKENKADGVIIDGVEARMRAEMQKQKELASLEQIRKAKFGAKEKARIHKEAEHAKMLRSKKREQEEKERAAKDQKAVVVQQSREEKAKETERRKNDEERFDNLRSENIKKKSDARLNLADCGSAFRKNAEAELLLAEEDDANVAVEA